MPNLEESSTPSETPAADATPKAKAAEAPTPAEPLKQEWKPPVLETNPITGPCGDENPCGGGFGTGHKG